MEATVMGKCEQASKASIIELGTCNIFKSLTMNILAAQGYSSNCWAGIQATLRTIYQKM
jgi:hypothetical protein